MCFLPFGPIALVCNSIGVLEVYTKSIFFMQFFGVFIASWYIFSKICYIDTIGIIFCVFLHSCIFIVYDVLMLCFVICILFCFVISVFGVVFFGGCDSVFRERLQQTSFASCWYLCLLCFLPSDFLLSLLH